jgi:hypothetical protein
MSSAPNFPAPPQGPGVPPPFSGPPNAAGPPDAAVSASLPGPAHLAEPPVPSGPPAPPPGPGVHPPFPAPPVEGKGKRIGWGIGIAAGVVVLVCGGGLAALIGVGVSMQGSYQEKAHAAVGGYLNALRDKKYDAAYDLLCDETQQDETAAEFRSKVSSEPGIQTYTMGDFDLVSGSVPVNAVYENGDRAQLEAYLGVDRDTGGFEVCSLGE